ncbi:potassium transporter KefB [Psychromonas sp. psych-6C06]|uniref:cation:proton antiporter n=1 Tax=Psychromonas sp. psych-6C06 TaxID=2058089 RepID=UPI000C33CDF5|nr:cation:proton antiporter [Psychromonas sp. psych-6C06]PKF62864.1 potassium transporter KefB [Psychromonas sp. psych-6C06]
MLTDLLLLLCCAIISVIVFRRLRLSNIIAYLFTGFMLGPSLLNFLGSYHEIELIAEFGIVFLMFSLGLEFSLNKLIEMRRSVFGLGALQVIVSFLLFYFICQLFTMTWQQSFTVAGILTMSSTAIIVKVLTDQQQLHSQTGKLAIAILLFQDLAVVPFLIIIPIIAMPGMESGLVMPLSIAFVKGAFAVIVLLAIGRWVLPKFFDEMGRVRFDEIFILSNLFVTLLAAWFTQFLGLSMALGAFLAGMMLAESHYRHQLAADIRPFKDILMAIFFISIGTLLSFDILRDNLGVLLLMVFGMMIAKMITITLAALIMNEKITTSLGVGIALAQMGEFGFILVALASKYELIGGQLSSLLIATGVISMSLTPLLVKYSQVITREALHHYEKVFRFQKTLPGQFSDHTIICGYGRVGQIVSRFLRTESLPFIVLDRDPMRVKEAREGGEQVEFGDASRREILLIAGIEKAKLLIITFNDLKRSLALLAQIRALNADVKVLVRTKNDKGLDELHEAGATEVVPEVLEGSLMLVAHVLYLSGIPHKKILKRLDCERKTKYQHLHGFYYGQDSRAEKGLWTIEKLHAVTLPQASDFIGSLVVQFNFNGVVIKSLNRSSGEEVAVTEKTKFKAGDVVLLQGDKSELLKAEQALQAEGYQSLN